MRRCAHHAMTVAIGSSTTLVAIPSAYLAAISIAGLLPSGRSVVPNPGEPRTRFAILVPAHDEETVIAEALSSFDQLDYPRDLLSVHVVADNCTDGTADRVRASAWTVHERDMPDEPGKGPALNWLFHRLTIANERFDAAVIVDADTSLDPGFLLCMDVEFQGGALVAQGYYTVRNPEPSPTSSFRYAALACRHRLRPLGRTRLGGSCGLYGNGMMFKRSVLDGRRWSGHLVEDAEMQNELLLNDIRVTFVPDAVLWAEIPDTSDAARSQNERWERGRIDLARRYVPRLVRALPRATNQRVAHADAVLDHLTPPLSALVMLQLAAGTAASAGALAGHRPSRFALAINILALGTVAAHAVAGLASAGADRRHMRSLLAAPAQIVWKTGLWLKMLTGRREVAWTRTQRNAEPHRGAA